MRPEQIPYGVKDFKRIRLEDFYYVDKTAFIRRLEARANFLFFVRPRRFGKSLLCETLRCYYDVAEKGNFDRLFGGLDIGRDPTANASRYFVLSFDFSFVGRCEGTNWSEKFARYLDLSLESFIRAHADVLAKDPDGRGMLEKVGADAKYDAIVSAARRLGLGVYVIVDEYDNFTNEIVSTAGKVPYKEITHGTGFYRGWFKLFKGTCDRIFMTGVSPVTMDDLTSGFNIATNITQEEGFNAMVGFTTAETRRLFEDFQGTGRFADAAEGHLRTVKAWYDSYCFSRPCAGRETLYNCDMALYYLGKLVASGRPPENLIDANIRSDWNKLRAILAAQRHAETYEGVLPLMEQLVRGEEVSFPLADCFPFDDICDEKYFKSFYYYYGIVTVSRVWRGNLQFRIPNESVRSGIAGCMREAVKDVFDAEGACEAMGCKHGLPGWPDAFGRACRDFFDTRPVQKVRTLSLFSGAGGLDIGFSDAGFEIVDAVEIERKFCDTLELNTGKGKRFANSRVNCIDIREFSGHRLGKIDFIVGGPPCQTFSAAGRRANGVLGTTDARGVLFREYVRLLKELRPKGFLFENVYGLTGAQGGKAWREIQDSFAEVGYRIFSRVLDAADYGVPQHRERLIIVGVREGEYKFPRPTHGPDSLAKTPYYNAGTAIRGLALTEEEQKPGLGGRFGHLLEDIPPGLNYSYYTKEMGHPRPVFAWRSKFSDFLYKADPDAPVRTIKAQGGAYTGPLHWGNRFFALSEYKRLQTFPDDYEISGGKQVAVKQIGNSVPPQLARMLAISIQEQLFGVQFPFRLPCLNAEDKLTFRSRKHDVMERYRRKAKSEISKLPKAEFVRKPYRGDFFCRLSDKFKFERCDPCKGAFRIRAEGNDILSVSVFDEERKGDGPSFVIEIASRGLAWDIPFSRVLLSSYSESERSFTVAWKAFENMVSEWGIRADLVQLNGYYQYAPTLDCKCRFLRPYKHADIISKVVAGEDVRRIVSEAELIRDWNMSGPEIVEVALELRKLGYEVRNNKTNPQIEPGMWLIPYAFPTLNHMSVQLGKEIR